MKQKPDRDELSTFDGLRRIIATLRGPDGCPWDRVQTHRSLRQYLLEETSETLAAIDDGNATRLCEELGDLLFEVLLQVQIAEEAATFRLDEVVRGVAGKLVRRHPHVFGDAVAETPEAVVEQWDELKRRERGQDSALTGIPDPLPALAYAQAIQRRAEGAGFAFLSVDQAWEALAEELDELRRAETPRATAGGGRRRIVRARERGALARRGRRGGAEIDSSGVRHCFQAHGGPRAETRAGPEGIVSGREAGTLG